MYIFWQFLVHINPSPAYEAQVFPWSIYTHHHHHNGLPKGRSFTANSVTKSAVLPKSRSPTENPGTKVAILPGKFVVVASRCFPHPSLSLFSIWTDLKSSETIPGAPTWRRGEWICVTGPSRRHRKSPQGLNISSIKVFNRIRYPDISIILCPLFIQGDWNIHRLGYL